MTQQIDRGTWYAGSPCARAGHTKRYTKNHACVECDVERGRRRRAADPEGMRKYYRTWRADNPGKAKLSSRRQNWKRHGLAPAAAEAALEAHTGRCGLCDSPTPGGHGTWNVDHCHSTGVVRGVLCHSCNVGLGCLKDDPALLRRAAAYVERNRELRRRDSE